MDAFYKGYILPTEVDKQNSVVTLSDGGGGIWAPGEEPPLI